MNSVDERKTVISKSKSNAQTSIQRDKKTTRTKRKRQRHITNGHHHDQIRKDLLFLLTIVPQSPAAVRLADSHRYHPDPTRLERLTTPDLISTSIASIHVYPSAHTIITTGRPPGKKGQGKSQNRIMTGVDRAIVRVWQWPRCSLV